MRRNALKRLSGIVVQQSQSILNIDTPALIHHLNLRSYEAV
eukprot:COSAG02_NODE_47758_length_338_cov_62.389121_1_plen_40_part_10